METEMKLLELKTEFNATGRPIFGVARVCVNHSVGMGGAVINRIKRRQITVYKRTFRGLTTVSKRFNCWPHVAETLRSRLGETQRMLGNRRNGLRGRRAATKF